MKKILHVYYDAYVKIFAVCAKAFSKPVYQDINGIYTLERQKFLVVLMTDKKGFRF